MPVHDILPRPAPETEPRSERRVPPEAGHAARPRLRAQPGNASPRGRLSAAREAELARRARAGDREAEEELVEALLPFVRTLARRYARYGARLDDLMQEGALGLVQAVRRFDADQGARLAAFAQWWVRSAMQDQVIRSWSIVRIGTTAAQRALFFRLRRIAADLVPGEKGGSEAIEATLRQLAERTRASMGDLMATAQRITGRDRPIDSAAGTTADETAGTAVDPRPSPEAVAAARAERRLASRIIDEGLTALPPRERTVIELRYLDQAGRSLAAIAAELGLSKQRVRQLEQRALARLRAVATPLALAAAHPAPAPLPGGGTSR